MGGAVQVGALVINMAADVASLKVSLAEANRAAATSAEKMASGFGAIKTSIESAVAPLKSLTVSVGSLESNMARAQGGAMSLAKGLLLGAAAGMSIDAVTRKITGVIETMAHLKDVSEKTGSSVENLSKLGFAAKQSGSDIDSVANALGKMSKGMAGADNDTKGAGLALKFLGISAKDSAGNLKDPAAMFTEIAVKLADYRDGAGKAAIAQALFGKAGAEMLPTLKLLAEQGDTVAKTTDAQSTAARQYERDLAKLEAQKNSIFKTIAVALLPTMSDFSSVLLDASKNTNVLNGSAKKLSEDKSIEEWADNGSLALALLIDGIKILPSLFSGVGNEISLAAKSLGLLASAIRVPLSKRSSGAVEQFKADLAEVKEAWAAADDHWEKLLGTKTDATFRAMQAKIAARSKAKSAVALDTTEDAAMATPWTRPKDALNWNSAGEDGPTKAAAAIDKEATAYATLISAIRSKTAENQLELAAANAGTPSQKERIKMDQELASGKLKLSAAHIASARSALDDQAASESLLKTQKTEKEVVDLIYQSTAARNESKASLQSEYELYGRGNDARAIAMIGIKAQSDLEKSFEKFRAEKKPLSEELIGQLTREKDERVKVEQATMAQGKALAYATQLKDENKKFGIDYILDDKARAAASLRIEADMWNERIKLAGDGTEAQKLLQGEYSAWYKNQLLKPQLDADMKMWNSIESTAHDTFVSIFNSGKSAFDRLRDTLKNGLLDMLYQMTVKKWIFNIGASVTGGGAAGMAQAATGAANGVSGASSLFASAGNAYSMISGGMTMAGGLGTGFMGSIAGGLSGAGVGSGLTSAAGLAVGESIAGVVGAEVAGAMASGMGMLAAAAPYLAAALAVYAVWKSLDTSGTYHTGGASSASAVGSKTIRAESLNFEATRTNSETEKMTAALASGIVNILDSTASAFGKTAGYTAATAFADDTSKDGAWGGLVIDKLGAKILDWQDSKTGAWAPKVFADGAAGQAEYLAAISTSVRTALDGIGLPAWAGKMLDDLGSAPSLEELAKAVGVINTTQSALVIMSEKLTNFSMLSESAATALIGASGGIGALTSSASSYYDNFYKDAEKTAGVTKQVTDALKAVNIAMPATRDEFRAQMEAQMALGDAGVPAVAALLKVQGAFAQLVPVLDATAVAAKKTAGDYVSAYLAAGASVRDSLASLGGVVSGLYDKVQSAAAGVKSSQAAISTAYFGAQDGVAAAQQKITDLATQSAQAMATFSGSIRDFLASVNAGQGGASGLASLKAQFSSTAVLAQGGDKQSQSALLGIASKLIESLKSNSGNAVDFAISEARVKATLGRISSGIDATNPASSADPMIAAQADLLKAQNRLLDYAALASVSGANTDRASQIIAGSTTALLAAFNDATTTSNSAREDYATALTLTSNLALTSTNSLSGLMAGLQSVSDAQATFLKARDELAAYVVSTEINSKNLDKFAVNLVASLGLTGTAADALKIALTSPGTAASTLAEMLGSGAIKMTGATDLLALGFGGTQGALASIAAALKGTGTEADILSGLLGPAVLGTAAQSAASSLGLVGTAAQSLVALMGSFSYTPPALPSLPSAGTGPAELTTEQRFIASLYNDILGRLPDSVGLTYWADKLGAGAIDLTSAATAIAMSAAHADGRTNGGAGWTAAQSALDDTSATAWLHARGVPGFAAGGMFGGGMRIVGEHGPELESTGPARIWNASQTRSMLGGGGDTSALEAAVARLTATVERQQAALDRIASHTEKTKNVLVRATKDGEAMQTEVAK